MPTPTDFVRELRKAAGVCSCAAHMRTIRHIIFTADQSEWLPLKTFASATIVFQLRVVAGAPNRLSI